MSHSGYDARIMRPAREDDEFRKASRKLDKSLTAAIKEGKQMSVIGKIAALTGSATEFNQSTPVVLDGIAEKIALATKKRDELAAKHHAYYDGIIKGADESMAVVDRLSNVPLGEGSES
jgi:hypothetical protein